MLRNRADVNNNVMATNLGSLITSKELANYKGGGATAGSTGSSTSAATSTATSTAALTSGAESRACSLYS